MENVKNSKKIPISDRVLARFLETVVLVGIFGALYMTRNQGKVEELLNCVAGYDGRRGISVADFKVLENMFYETDPRHEFAQNYTGGRMQPYIGNPAIKMRGITSWDDPNEKKLDAVQKQALKRVLYKASFKESSI